MYECKALQRWFVNPSLEKLRTVHVARVTVCKSVVTHAITPLANFNKPFIKTQRVVISAQLFP